jgi:uncharacterized protein YndB with AHSA1/START domain
MAKVTASIHLDAPPEAVWDLVMDPERFGEWVTIHLDTLRSSARPLTTGAEIEQRLCLRHVPFTVRWRVVEYDRPRRGVFEGRGPARSKAWIVNELQPTPGGGTDFRYTNDFRAPFGPLGSVAASALMGGVPRHEADASLQRLKDIVESAPGTTVRGVVR